MRSTLQRLLALAPFACVGLAHGAPQTPSCPSEAAGLALPPGFCATIFADRLGHARHLTVSAQGVVYVNTWSGRYYANAKPPSGGFLVALKDSTGAGKADVIERFGRTPADGGKGGTGVALYGGALYAEEGDSIVRYRLAAGEVAPKGESDVIVSGLPLSGDHPMHPFVIDAKGNIYMDSGSATNSCQVKNRTRESPGLEPCKELETRAGIWRYAANQTGQTFSPAARFATGVRNGEGFAIDGDRVFVTQHGRDQLSENWPKLYKPEQGPELPAEELLELDHNADFGWPECYYDGVQKKRVLAPEYGGDGGRKQGVCAGKKAPLAAFPAHWAPNDLLLYHGAGFPAAYDGGFFIAFHGSWNRAPLAQGGYNVVFQPATGGQPTGDYVVFADGFAGAAKEPGAPRIGHRDWRLGRTGRFMSPTT